MPIAPEDARSDDLPDAGFPVLRLLPIPPCAPPYDDEREAQHVSRRGAASGYSAERTSPRTSDAVTASSPALFLVPEPLEMHPALEEGTVLRLVPPPTDDLPAASSHGSLTPLPCGPMAYCDEADGEERRTPSADLPPARPFALALVQRLLEVAAGVRPVAQLQRDTSLELYETLERVLSRGADRTSRRPTARAVRSLHVQQRPDGVAEVCATVHRGGPGERFSAVALRIEGFRGQWRCMALTGM